MASLRWTGKAIAVAQVATGTIDSLDATPANNTYTVTIGGVAISQVGTVDVTTTATALRVLLNASSHPYFAAITWSGIVGNIIGTADSAGVPFVGAALTETGAGSGAVTDFAATVSNSGPNVLAAANFDTGLLPDNSDTVVFENSSTDVFWNLDALTAITGLKIKIFKTFTGKIGLNKRVFQTTGAGAVSSLVEEYREDELTIDGCTLLNLPEHFGTTTPAGSNRLLFNLKATQATILIEDTSSSAAELNEPVRIRGTHTDNALYVNGGTVGFCTNDPFDAGALATLFSSERAKVIVNPGVTALTTATCDGSSTLYLQCAATTVNINDGFLVTQGTGAITTLNVNGGTSKLKSSGTITTLNLNGGNVDMSEDNRAKTITTLNSASSKGVSASIMYDPNVITITNKLNPSRACNITVSGA